MMMVMILSIPITSKYDNCWNNVNWDGDNDRCDNDNDQDNYYNTR